MKERIKENAWILMCVVVILMCVVAYRIVDCPEKVGAAEDPYTIPQAVLDSAERWGNKYGICPELLVSIAWAESRYNPNAVNKSGTCHGLMQISLSAHSQRMARLGVGSLYDLDGNMKVAADYLRELFSLYEDPAIVLGMYHGESDALTKTEMSGYTAGILEMSYELETRHGKHNGARFTPGLDWSKGVG